MSEVQNIEEAPLLNQHDIKALLQAQDSGPCVSIYIDTLPETHAKDKNRIRYKDQIKKAIDALENREMDKYVRRGMIKQLEHVGQSEDFWLYQQYGLAVFLSSDRVAVRKLMAEPGNAALVADTYHLRPALQILRDAQRHQILCVSLEQVALYEGDGRTISRIELHPDVATDMASAIGIPPRVHKVDSSDPGGDEDDQLRRYFKRIDDDIWKYHNRDAGLPLLLVALNEHQGLFHEVSSNPNLLDNALERDPFDGISENELGRLAWQEVRDALASSLDRLAERFNSEYAHDRAAKSLEAIGSAAAIGQIETLLVNQDCRIGGALDRTSGEVRLAPINSPHAGDVIDDITALTIATEGDIWFLPPERMPSDTGLAAILRFTTE